MFSLSKLERLHDIDPDSLVCIKEYIGEVVSVERILRGLVHYVYRVKGRRGVVYLKIRSDHFSGVPEIKTDPSLIKDEAKALHIYYSYFPEVFPRILKFDENNHYLILSDVIPGQETFEDVLNNHSAKDEDIYSLGRTIGKIHFATSHIHDPIRPEGDDAFRDRQLFYLLELSNHPVLTNIVKEYKRRPTNLILGDPSPKNMGVSRSEIGICDLENSRQCSYIFELAHMIAHLLIHNLNEKKEADKFIKLFLKGYKKHMPKTDIADSLLAPTILGILLYRLNNPVIPYNLNLNYKERLNFENKARSLLDKQSLTTQEIINKL